MQVHPLDDELLRARISDDRGHLITFSVSAEGVVRVEVIGPAGVEVRGRVSKSEFEHFADTLARLGSERTTGMAGRFYVSAKDTEDVGGYVDWGNGGPTMWLYPNRTNADADWCRVSMVEASKDIAAIRRASSLDDA